MELNWIDNRLKVWCILQFHFWFLSKNTEELFLFFHWKLCPDLHTMQSTLFLFSLSQSFTNFFVTTHLVVQHNEKNTIAAFPFYFEFKINWLLYKVFCGTSLKYKSYTAVRSWGHAAMIVVLWNHLNTCQLPLPNITFINCDCFYNSY